jgi:hypothetical protein
MTKDQAERLIQILGIIARGTSPDWAEEIVKIVEGADNEDPSITKSFFNN